MLIVSIAVLLLNAAGSSAQENSTLPPAARLPANYRQLMAEYVRTHNPYVVHSAMISKPFEKYGGILRGGTYAVVCVEIVRDNVLGIPVRDDFILTYEHGRVTELLQGLSPCSNLSPFTELKER
jgi:hypothetical protein